MILSVQLNQQVFQLESDNPLDLSIPLNFNGEQPNAFGVEKATARPCTAGALVGDTRLGGSCNFEQITLIPHCNGTHTECVGHLTNERISIRTCLRDSFVPALLISVAPQKASETKEKYVVELTETDRMITRKLLDGSGLENYRGQGVALIVRTLPNGPAKLSRTYLDEIPPFFSTQAMEFISEIGVEHLLVDLPSIDRIDDGGQLSNHRIFWNVEPGSFEVNPASFIHRTITELIYVREDIADGFYFLNLQIAPLAADSSPSRPLLFKIL